MTLQRVNQYGAADTELARLQFAQQINTISLNTGTPIAIVEQLAETAHRTRVEEVEATMNSHYSNEIRRIEVDAARTTSNYEARCISEMSELRQVASRNEMGNHEHMVRQHYQVVAGRDQAIQQLRTELAVSQSQLQSVSNSEATMKQRAHDAEAVAKQLADEMNIAEAQVASLGTTSQKIVEDMRNEFAQKEDHLRRKLEADILAQSHTIGILKTKVATQTNELAEEKTKLHESNEKHRSMYEDIQIMRNELRENQSLREELLDGQMESRRLRAELDAVPKRSPEENQEVVKDPCRRSKSPKGVELSLGKRRRRIVMSQSQSHGLMQGAKYRDS